MSIIRLATEADIPFIDADLYPHLHNNHVPSEGRICYVISSQDYYLVVADEGTINQPFLLGTCTMHVIMQAASAPHGMMNDLVVHPDRTREGVGRLLFEYLEDVARKRSCKTIFFTCSPKRITGNKFHIFMGYKMIAAAVDENGTNLYEKELC